MAAVDLTTHPGHLARRLQQAHYLLWNTMVSEEITSPQFAVLNALVAEPGVDQRTAGERVGLDRSTIAEVISRLGRRGCWTRSATRRTAAVSCCVRPRRACASTASSPCGRLA